MSHLEHNAWTPLADDGVSPVIATILLVALAVIFSAGVYVAVSLFTTDEEQAELASVRMTSADGDDDGRTDWIRLQLASGRNAPYTAAWTVVHLVGPGSAVLSSSDEDIVCTAPTEGATDDRCDASVVFSGAAQWDEGESLYVPCQDAGRHTLTVTVNGNVILDGSYTCDAAAG